MVLHRIDDVDARPCDDARKPHRVVEFTLPALGGAQQARCRRP